MNRKLILFCVSLSIITLSGCALIDKNIFEPAASLARVDPLFRTAECKNYNAADGKHWLDSLTSGSTRNISSFFSKDTCDYQTRSINDTVSSPDKDRLYFTTCEIEELTNLAISTKDWVVASKDKAIADADKAKADADKDKAEKDLVKARDDKSKADADKAIADKSKTKVSRNQAKKSQDQANESQKIAETSLGLAKISAEQAKLSEDAAKISQDQVTTHQSLAKSCFNYLAGKSDEICENHKSHIFGNRAAVNTTLQILATGAGIAGSMTGVGAAQALAGSAGFLTGSQAIINEEVYHNLVSQGIIQQINTNRKDFLAEKLTAYNTAELPSGLTEIRRDAVDYHNHCSFYDGLTSLLSKADDKKTEQVNPVLNRLISQGTKYTNKKTTLSTEISKLDDVTDKTLKDQKKLELAELDKQISLIDGLIGSIPAEK